MELLNNKFRQFLRNESNKWDPKRNWRLPSVAYTLEHKLAFLERQHYLLGHYSWSGFCHDLDKVFLYCNPLLHEDEIQKIHRKRQAHHAGSKNQKKVSDLIEMYIDWDCAALTKPDKPLDAFATLLHFYPQYLSIMLPVCLAINPLSVSPLVMDLDAQRKNKVSTYLFQSQRNNLILYQQTLLCLEKISLQNFATLKLDFNADIHRLEAWKIFAICLNILAQTRKQKIDFDKLSKVLSLKQQEFYSYEAFSINPHVSAMPHHHLGLLDNPFFV